MLSNFLFSKVDLKMLQQSHQDFIDFKPSDIQKFKKIIGRDLAFMVANDITGYNLQFIIERRTLEQNDLRPTSFVSKNGKYIYHFGLKDYTQKYSSMTWFQRKKAKTAEAYRKDFKDFIERHLLDTQNHAQEFVERMDLEGLEQRLQDIDHNLWVHRIQNMGAVQIEA